LFKAANDEFLSAAGAGEQLALYGSQGKKNNK